MRLHTECQAAGKCLNETGNHAPCEGECDLQVIEDFEREERWDCPLHGLQDGPECPRC